MTALRIGTRGSDLALWQARRVASLLHERGRATEIVVIKTTGDRLQRGSLAQAGGRRLFVNEIEDALELDAIVLGSAGLKRLGYGYRISAPIAAGDSIPAPGQGIVAIQIRRDDGIAAAAVRCLNDASAFACLEAERAVVSALGGCQLPLGLLATPLGTCLRLDAFVGSVDGLERITATAQGPMENAAMLGRIVAEQLATGGAVRLLEAAGLSARPELPHVPAI